jgi:hypothetical protein
LKPEKADSGTLPFLERGTGLPSVASAAFVLRDRCSGMSGVCDTVRDEPGGGETKEEPCLGRLDGVPLDAISLGP